MNARKTENTSELIPLTREEMTTIIGGVAVDHAPSTDTILTYQNNVSTNTNSGDDPNEPIDI